MGQTVLNFKQRHARKPPTQHAFNKPKIPKAAALIVTNNASYSTLSGNSALATDELVEPATFSLITFLSGQGIVHEI